MITRLPVTARPLDARGVAPMTRRILAEYRSASLEELTTGAAWYPHAHDVARDIAEETGLEVLQVAGVIAALSPQNAWEKNVKDAWRACRRRSARGLHTGCQVGKADAIIAGADPLDILAGTKERSFFGNIADPSDAAPVTIDRHAHDIAVGRRFGDRNRGLGAAGRYANIALAYRRAARILGVAPSTVQAVTWQRWTGRTTLLEREEQPAAWADDVVSAYGV